MKPINIIVLAEGQSEKKVIESVIAPNFYHLNVYLTAFVMPTSKNGKGGAVNFDRLFFNIKNFIEQDYYDCITTFLDFYQLKNDFPDYELSMQQNDIYDKIAVLEQALHKEVITKLNCHKNKFIPHIQPHELESLLFSNVSIYGKVEPNWQTSINKLQGIVSQFDNVEYINNHYTTAPSKRLEKILNPSYRKTRHAPLIAEQIGLPTIETACPHFHSWLTQLRQLSVLTEN